MATLQMVPTSEIHRHPHNPRRPVTDAGDLVASVKDLGILSPITVVADPEGGYLLIAGERRLFAATANDLPNMPAQVLDLDERATIEALVVDNLQREDLTPAEEAAGYQSMLDLGMDVDTIAERVGRSPKHVETHAAASKLDVRSVNALHEHALTLDQALALGAIEDVPEILADTLDKIAAGGNAAQIVRDAQIARTAHFAWLEVRAYGEKHGIEVVYPTPAYDAPPVKITGDKDAIKAHQGLACYAVSRDPYGTKTVAHYCMEPKSHKGKNAAAPKATDVDRDKDRHARRLVVSNNRRFEEMGPIRFAWLDQFVVRKTPPKVYLPQVVALLAGVWTSNPMRDLNHGPQAVDLDALTTPAAAMHLISAVVREVEGTIQKDMWRHTNALHARYLKALASWGYTLTEPEAMYVEAVTNGADPSTLDYGPSGE